MAKLTAEHMEELMDTLDKGFSYITDQNIKRAHQVDEAAAERKRILDEAGAPEPMTIQQIGDVLNVRIEPRHEHDDKTFLAIFTALEALPQDTENYDLIAASCIWQVKQYAPWAIKDKSPFK